MTTYETKKADFYAVSSHEEIDNTELDDFLAEVEYED